MRHRSCLLLICAGAALMGITDASSQDDLSPLWEKVGRWEIRVDTTLDYGCFAAVIENNKVFRIGIDNLDSDVYAIVGKVGWESIEQGKAYDIDVEFDSEGAWEVPAVGINMNGTKGLAFEIGDTLFLDELMERHTMYVDYNGRQILRMSMEGSIRAIQSLGACMETFNDDSSQSDRQADPFASPDDDPFKPSY